MTFRLALLTVAFSRWSYWIFQDRSFLALFFFSRNWIWILQEAVEAIKEGTVVEEVAVEEVVAVVEAAEMVIGIAQTPGKLSFLCLLICY